MSRSTILCLSFILALFFMVSCSGGSGNVVAPPPGDRDVALPEASGSTSCFGLWQVVIDKHTGNADITQLRAADQILNVLGFMEPPPFKCMDLPYLDIDPVAETVDVEVQLIHPLTGDPTFTGFDVRGVCFGPEVANADGLTVIPSPEYFAGEPFGYQDGLLGAPDSYGNYEGLAGYKYFCDDLGVDDELAAFMSDPGNLDNRGSYASGSVNTRRYLLDWSEMTSPINFLVFNYAVYANYNWPTGTPPPDLDDFDLTTANSAEAFCCSVTELANSLYYAEGFGGGGAISLMVELWDWQGNITDVTIETLDGEIAQTPYTTYLGAGGTPFSYLYDFYAVPGNPTTTGELDIIITATDEVTFGGAWFMDLLTPTNSMYDELLYNCFVHTAIVIECPPAEVTGISPDTCWSGEALTGVTVTGTFMDGPQLAVALTKTGEADIDATNVTFVDDSTITCDIDTAGAAGGLWDVEVTNGCGTPGVGVELFNIIATKNIELRSGVTAYDLAIVNSTGDLYILYSDGQVWEYTEANNWQSGAQLYTTNTRCRFIDASPNGDSVVEGDLTSGSYYSRSYYANGGAASQHTALMAYWAHDNYCPWGGTDNNRHCTWSGCSYYPTICWGWSPSSYGGASGYIVYEGSGYSNIHHNYLRGLEPDSSSYVFCFEGSPEYRVERRRYRLYSYAGPYWGGHGDTSPNFNEPKDICMDSSNMLYCLDELSTGDPAIKKFNTSGTPQGTYGDTTTISSDPLRIESSRRLWGGSGACMVVVLHGNGTDGYMISIFLPGELS